jgi:hypothetical protein
MLQTARNFLRLSVPLHTLSQLPSNLLGANLLNRYLINAAMLPNLKWSADVGVTHLAPKAPQVKESHWLATRPDERFFGGARFYGPTEALARKTWKLGDVEEVK